MTHDRLREPSSHLFLVADALERWHNRTAFECGGQVLTYGETADQIGRSISAMAAKGIGTGDRVGVLAKNSPEAWIVTAAAQFLGAVSVGLHAKSSADDHVEVAEAASLSMLLAGPEFGASAEAVRQAVPGIQILALGDAADIGFDFLAKLPKHPPAKLEASADNEDVIELIYTGGTTGRSKGVVQSHRSRAAISLASQLAYELPVEPCYLASAPITHASGHFVVPTLMRGGRVVLTDGFDSAEFIETVNRHRVSLTFLVPSMIYKLLDAVTGDEKLSMPSLERIIYGASPMAPDRLVEAHERIGRVFTQIWGQTESLGLGTSLLSGEHDLDDPARLISCGRQVPGTLVSLRDEENRQVQTGEVGELCLRGPSVMNEYLDQPDLTAETLAGGWLHTGDVGRADELGYITIVDRRKDFIITGGFNVYSREVEDVLLAHPTVAGVAVIGVPDEVWGEAVAAIIVPAPGATIDSGELKAAVRAAKGPVHAPKSIEVVDALPMTAVGKIDKGSLRSARWSGRDRVVG